MAITIKHAKTDNIADWTQADLDAQIALGNFPAGTVLADIVLPSDWNNDHTLSGTVPIANGGTGQTTATQAINALLPSQTSQSGKVLSTDGTNTSWIAAGGTGTVTSVTGTAPVSVATGTTTPVISMAAANTTTNGYLTSTDWNTFNGKGSGTLTSITAGTGLSGGTITSSGTIAIDATVVTLTGSQTLTNKVLTAPRIDLINDTNGNEILGFSPTTSATDYFVVKNGIGVGAPIHLYADGSSSNTGMHIQPKGTGLVTISDGTDFNKGIRFRSSGSAASAVTLLDAVSTAGRVVTLPDATTTLVGRDTTDTLTNKSISGSTNTLSNIGNAALTNSSITINGSAISLGGTVSVGTVTSVTGTAPVVSSGGATPAISMAAASSTVNGYLTSTDWTTFNSKGSGTVTSASVVSANGFAGTVATATTTPAITISTSITGVLKGNGTAISAATSGTDYAPATSGSSILYGNGSGGFSNVTIGSGLSFSTGTLSASGSSGVTSFQTSLSGLTPSTASTGVVTLAGTLGISSGGTGQATATAAFNALAPTQTSNTGKFLKTDGTNTSWSALPSSLLVLLHSGSSTTSVSVANGVLPILNHSGSTINVAVT